MYECSSRKILTWELYCTCPGINSLESKLAVMHLQQYLLNALFSYVCFIIFTYNLGTLYIHLSWSCYLVFHCQCVYSISKCDIDVSICLLPKQWINSFWIFPHRMDVFCSGGLHSFRVSTCHWSAVPSMSKHCPTEWWLFTAQLWQDTTGIKKNSRYKSMLGYREPKLHYFV